MEQVCYCCGAKLFKGEVTKKGGKISSSLCCSHGAVKLKHVPPLLNDHNFRRNIRLYNSALALTSLGVKPDAELEGTTGPYTFRIQGGVYHLIGAFLPDPVERPRFSQLYVYDPDFAGELQARFVEGSRLDLSVLGSLQRMLHDVNPYVRAERSP